MCRLGGTVIHEGLCVQLQKIFEGKVGARVACAGETGQEKRLHNPFQCSTTESKAPSLLSLTEPYHWLWQVFVVMSMHNYADFRSAPENCYNKQFWRSRYHTRQCKDLLKANFEMGSFQNLYLLEKRMLTEAKPTNTILPLSFRFIG